MLGASAPNLSIRPALGEGRGGRKRRKAFLSLSLVHPPKSLFSAMSLRSAAEKRLISSEQKKQQTVETRKKEKGKHTSNNIVVKQTNEKRKDTWKM